MTKTAGDEGQWQDVPHYAVVADPSTVADVPAAQRKAEIGKVWEAFFARMPEDDRAKARKRMEVGFVGVFVSSVDPEIARLLSRLMSLQLAELPSEHAQPWMVTPSPVVVPVKVALVTTLQNATGRAVVVRRPDDGGVPLLLIPRTATGEDLLLGLRAAKRTAARYDVAAGKTSTVIVKFGARRKSSTAAQVENISRWERALTELRQAPETEIEGHARARTLMMVSFRRRA